MFKTTEDIYNEIQEVKRLLESLINSPNDSMPNERVNDSQNDDYILNQFYDEINLARKEHNLKYLKVNKFLEKAADNHAHDMFINNFVNHSSSTGMSYEQRIKMLSPHLIPMGECLLKGPGGQNAIKIVVQAWIETVGLRDIILNPNLKYVGAGYRLKTDEIKGNYWCAVFAN